MAVVADVAFGSPIIEGIANPTVSVVVPCYNEALVVDALFTRLKNVLEGLQLEYEIVFINDGSTDGTLNKLILLAQKNHETVRVIDFSRNFGHQIAVTAGMQHARGDVVILIDADLQDPPELIGTFIEKWKLGYDVVYAIREERSGESWFKRYTAKRFYRLLRMLTDIEIPVDTGDFRLMSRRVVDGLLAVRERHPFIRGLVSWVGYEQIGIPYQREERAAGESKYPFSKMLRFAIDGVTSFSIKPLQVASVLGFFIALLGFIGALFILGLKLFTNVTVQGWTSIIMVVLVLGGVQLIILGIIGEYVGRIYDEVRHRPLYLTREKYNLSSEGDCYTMERQAVTPENR